MVNNKELESQINKEAKNRYLKSKAFQVQFEKYKNQLTFDFLSNEQKEVIANKLAENIPPGTLGSYRGNIFNEKIGEQIQEHFPFLEVKREVKVNGLSEKADVVVNGFGKSLIIYNQLDF